MSAYWAMFGKEYIDFIRTYKLFLLVTVFVLLAIMSPATAYFMADILNSAGINPDAINDPLLQNPTYLSSFQQFFGNVGQIGLLAVAIIFAGIVANDISKQTVVNLLTKGLKRDVVIYAKLAAAVSLWALAYLVSVAVMFGYTAYYFDLQNVGELVLPLVGIFEFGVIIIVILGLGGVLFKSQIGALLTVGSFVLVATLLGVFVPQVEPFNPIVLSTHGFSVAVGGYATSDFVLAMWTGLGVIGAGIAATLLSFRKVQF